MDTIDEIVLNAYNHYNKVRNVEIDERALQTLNSFHDKIDAWDGTTLQDIAFIQRYLFGPKMEAIASSGAAPALTANFKTIMLSGNTARKVSQLFVLRKNGIMTPGIVQKISEVKIIPHVLNHERQEGRRPKIYINRFLTSIFIEIMTAIASEGQLKDTARKLGKDPEGISFEKLQVQVRERIEESLNRQGIGSELTKFQRAAVAYHILEAN